MVHLPKFPPKFMQPSSPHSTIFGELVADMNDEEQAARDYAQRIQELNALGRSDWAQQVASIRLDEIRHKGILMSIYREMMGVNDVIT